LTGPSNSETASQQKQTRALSRRFDSTRIGASPSKKLNLLSHSILHRIFWTDGVEGYIDKPGFRFTPPRHISGKDKQEHRQDQVPEIAAVLALGENIEGLVDILSEQFTLRAVSYSPAEECINNCIDNRAECLSDK
jgi:hypothetical protein